VRRRGFLASLLALCGCAATGPKPKRKPRWHFSAARLDCAAISWGLAVDAHEAQQILLAYAARPSYAAVSRKLGRHWQTVRKVVLRAVNQGVLVARPTGGEANSPNLIPPAGLLFLRVRPRRAASLLCLTASRAHPRRAPCPPLPFPQVKSKLSGGTPAAAPEKKASGGGGSGRGGQPQAPPVPPPTAGAGQASRREGRSRAIAAGRAGRRATLNQDTQQGRGTATRHRPAICIKASH
jgi:hypothetical protein